MIFTANKLRSFIKYNRALTQFNVLFFYLATSTVWAQTDTMVVIDSLIITASRLPQKTMYVSPFISDRFQTSLSQASSVNDYLQSVPGLFTMSPDNYAQDTRMTSRGFGARSSFGIRGIKIWVDEIPETTPDGQSQLDNLDFNLIDQIEVLRGPNAALYGNVSGALIKIAQTNLDSLRSGLQIRYAHGSYGFRQAGVSWTKARANFNYQLSYGYHQNEGFRSWSEFKNHVANFRAKYKIGSKEFTLLFNAVYNPVSRDPGAQTLEEVTQTPDAARKSNVDYQAGEKLNQERLGLIFKNTASRLYYQVKTYILHRDFDNSLAFLSGGIVQIQRLCGGIYAEMGNAHTQGSHHWILGADWQQQSDRRSNFNNNLGNQGEMTLDQSENYRDISVYLLNHFKISEKLRTEWNFRISTIKSALTDRFRSDGDQSGSRTNTSLNPTINISYQLASNVGSRLQYSTGFETPTLAELSINPSGQPGFNQDLESSSSRGFELGFHVGKSKQNHLDLQVFTIAGKNELLPFEIPGSPGRFYYKNVGSSKRQGFELTIRKQVTDGLSLLFNHTKNYMKGDDITRNLPGIPAYLTQLQGYLEFTKQLKLRLDHALVGEIYLTQTQLSDVKNYVIGNIQASYTLAAKSTEYSLTLGINNMYQTRYYNNLRINANGGRYFEAAPSRNFWLRITGFFGKTKN